MLDFQKMFEEIGLTEEQISMMKNMADEYGMSFEPQDITEMISEYSPAPADNADRQFIDHLKNWLKSMVEQIQDTDVYTMGIIYHLGFQGEEMIPCGDVWFAYSTEAYYQENLRMSGERWNFANWKEHYAGSLEETLLNEWLAAKGLKLEEDDDEIAETIFDLAVTAVSELHEQGVIAGHFGRKIPTIMTNYDYYHMTAVRAVKANGAELFDEDFFDECCCIYQR